jgi:MIZ/SP-RING zinc finger
MNAQDILAAKRLAEANATTNHFLGATRRPWMTNAVTIPSLPAERDVLGPRRGRGTGIPSNVSEAAASEILEHTLEAQRQIQPPTERRQSAQSPVTRPVAESRNTSQGGISVTRKRSYDVAESGTGPRQGSASQQMQQPGITSPSQLSDPLRTATLLPGRQISVADQVQLLTLSTWHSLSSFEARNRSLGMIESQRLSLLKQACLQNDIFYLCAHQLFCTAARNPRWTIENRLDKDQCAGLVLLSLILLPNQDMAVEVLHFFADLPAPLEMLNKERVVYRSTIEQVAAFLGRAGVGWDFLRRRCFSRKSPAFSEELVDAFGVHSPILQRVMFNSIHRQLGGASNAKLCEQGLALFEEDQAQYQARKKNQGIGEIRSQAAMVAERKVLGERYKGLMVDANILTPQNVFPGHMVTPEQPMAMSFPVAPNQAAPNQVAPNQVAPSTTPSRRASASASAPYSAGSQQHHNYMQSSSVPNPLNRSRSTNNIRINTTFANSGITGEGSPVRIQQIPGPMNPPNFVPQSAPGSVRASPTYLTGAMAQPPALQQSRGRPPASSGPVVPHTPTAPGQRGGRGGHVGRGGHPGWGTSADHSVSRYPLLIPPLGYEPIQTTLPDPNHLALHQAYLKSPAVDKVNAAGQTVPDIRLYQYLESFAIPPKAIDPESSYLTWEFHTTASDMSKKAVDVTSSKGLTKRRLFDGSLLYRLRSVEVTQSLQTIDAGEWSVKDISWPPCCFVQFNNVDIELRRKLHHGKDLPIDLTPHVREGKNDLIVALLRGGEGKKAKRYAMAVEIVEVGDQTRVDSAPTRLPADESLRCFTQALTAPRATTAANDDEIQVVDSHISIDLIDPFMATIFDLPARGSACTHRECFDLQTFFQTRKSWVKGGPTSPDEWKCPICKKDARPQSLLVDCFLKTVRDSLVASGAAGDARAILIAGDGSWNVKRDATDATEAREGEGGARADMPASRGGLVAGSRVGGTANMVITIEDDD